MYTRTQIEAASEDIKSKLLSNDPGLIKQAAMGADDYFRVRIRENGIARRRMPPTMVTKDMLQYDEKSDFPTLLYEIEGDSAGAKLIPFETGPSNEVIHGRKIRIEFNRIMTPKYSIDKVRLEGYKMPLLDMLQDLMLKDIQDVEDTITTAVDNNILGEINQDNEDLGCRRYVTCGPMSREAVTHLRKAMAVTPNNLIAKQFLMNQLTYIDFGLLDSDKVGDRLAEDTFLNGVTFDKVAGIDVIVTTKKELIETNAVYVYTDPKYYGGMWLKDDVSMVTDQQDNIWLSFFAHEMIGASVVNAAAVAKGSFTGSLVSWENES